MKEFLSKHKILISVFIYLAVITAVFYFIADKLFHSIKANANLIQETLIDQDSRKKRLGESDKLEEQYNMIVGQEDLLGNLLTEGKAVGLIESLEKIAQETGNKVSIGVKGSDKEVKVSKKTETSEEKKEGIMADIPKSEHLELKLVITGSYDNFLKFLKKLEHMNYYNDIVNVSIAVKTEEQNQIMDNRISIAGESESVVAPNEEEPPPPSEPEFFLESTVVVLFYLSK